MMFSDLKAKIETLTTPTTLSGMISGFTLVNYFDTLLFANFKLNGDHFPCDFTADCNTTEISEITGVSFAEKSIAVTGKINLNAADTGKLPTIGDVTESNGIVVNLDLGVNRSIWDIGVRNIVFTIHFCLDNAYYAQNPFECTQLLVKGELFAQPIHISADFSQAFSPYTSRIESAITFQEVSVENIAKLGELIGFDVDDNILPSEISSLLNSVTLSEIQAMLNNSCGYEICTLFFKIELKDFVWKVFGDLVVENISLMLGFDTPYEEKEFCYIICGTLELFGDQLEVTADSRNGFKISVKLKSSTPIKLEDYLTQVSNIHAPVEGLLIDQLDLTFAKDHYTADIAINPQNSWAINIGKNSISITDVYLNIEYIDGKFHGKYRGNVAVSKTTSIYISAETGDNLTIKGGICLGDQGDFWDTFSDYAIPDWLKDIKINVVKLEYSNSLTLTIDSTVSINQFDCDMSLSLAFGDAVEITGNITISGQQFLLKYYSDSIGNGLLLAKLESGNNPLTLTSDMFGLPGGTTITTEKAYVLLVMPPHNGNKIFLVGVNLGADISLDTIPIVGSMIDSDKQFGIKNLIVSYNSSEIPKQEQDFINKNVASDLIPTYDAGINISGNLVLPDLDINLCSADENEASKHQTSAMTFVMVNNAENQNAKIKWYPINKALSFLSVKRIGIGLDGATVLLEFDGEVRLGCFHCELIGLGVSSSISNFNPVFCLGGISLGYTSPGIAISGILQKRENAAMKYDYSGGATAKLSQYGFIAAVDFGETVDNKAVFSIYFATNVNLIISPAFIITQLSAGFGYNEKLNKVTLEQVDTYPLVTGSADLSSIKTASVGDYWGAAGINFTVSELINGKLVMLARFGNDLSFDILGKSEFYLPKDANHNKDQAYLYVGVDILASLKPQEGVFRLQAQLSDESFLFTRQCKLNGGLAFSTWFGESEHAGDFVFTIGGYHPNFIVPAHYPVVPRVGFIWNVSDEVTIKGEAYLALTPSCVMAGGRLEATYQSGAVKAWFVAGVDLLVTYHPFRFDANIYINLGASVRLNMLCYKTTLTFNVGANLHLWGTPTGGEVTIHLPVLSFAIRFGQPKTDEPMTLEKFHELLPDDIHTLGIQDGLLSTEKDTTGKVINSMISSYGGNFLLRTAIPIGSINIRPLGVSGLQSKVVFKLNDEPFPSTWNIIAVTANVPDALWGAPLNQGLLVPDVPSATLIQGQTMGYIIEPPPPQKGDIEIFTLNNPSTGKSELCLSVCSFVKPLLAAGQYTLSTSQEVFIGKEKLSAGSSLNFEVQLTGNISGRYPKSNDAGDFLCVFPHIQFSVPTYPFAQNAAGDSLGILPWLVLVTVSEDEYKNITINNGKISFASDFIKSILPTKKELPYFVHSRTIQMINRDETDFDTAPQSFAVSNRLPAHGVNYAFLLSLKDVDLDKISGDITEFSLLEQFKFFTQNNTVSGFVHTVNALQKSIIKFDDDKGYLLPYHTSSCYWHGLFVKSAVGFAAQTKPLFDTAKQYISGNDFSLSTAFENARLAAIADTTLLSALFGMRSEILRMADRVADNFFDKDAFEKAVIGFSAMGNIIDSDKIAILDPTGYDNKTHIETNYSIDKNSSLLKTLVSLVNNIIMQSSVPEQYLFPKAEMFPQKSLQFFYVDKNIIAAALDGIFSIGIESERLKDINNCLYAEVYNQTLGKLPCVMTGFMINSELFRQWNNTEIYAFNADNKSIYPYSIRKLSAAKRIYIYGEEIQKVILREPQHNICTALTEDRKLMVKNNGNYEEVPLTSDCFRADGRTLDVEKVIEFSKAKTTAKFALDLLKTPETVTIPFGGEKHA